MKRILVLLLVLLLGLPALTLAATDGKIGYVDLQKALQASEAGKKAKEQIEIMGKKYQKPAETRQNELRKLQEEFDKQAMLLSEDVRLKREREFQQKVKEYQRFVEDIQDELQSADADHSRQIIAGLLKVAQEIGAKEGYTMLINGSIIYPEPKSANLTISDITDQVIKAYDARQRTAK
jgi:outer membrane protein